MLRTSKSASGREEHDIDAIDEQLLLAIDAGLALPQVVAQVPCAVEEAQARLMRLVHLGILENVPQGAGSTAQAARASDDGDGFEDQPTGLIDVRPDPAHSGVRSRTPSQQTAPGPTSQLDAGVRAALAEVDGLLDKLEHGTHYELLGVPTDAEHEVVRKAYGARARRFHPDVFFRKPIGDYRAKLDMLFAAITRAYDVLRVPEKRAEYDAELGLPARRIEAMTRRSVRATPSQPAGAMPSQPSRATSSQPVEVTPSQPVKPAPSRPVEAAASRPAEPAPSRTVATFARNPAPPPIATKPPPANLRQNSVMPGRGVSTPPSASAADCVHRISIAPETFKQAPAVTNRPPATPRSAPTATPSSPPATSMRAPTSAHASQQAMLRDIIARKGRPPEGATRAPDSAKGSSAYTHPPSSPQTTLENLVQELSKGDPNARWAATGLREALALERRGELSSALALLQVVVSRYSDPRVREQRDRVQAATRGQASTSHRERAVAAQNSKNFSEAAELWRKVSDADRKDAKAALQCAVCYLQAKDVKSAGPYAMRAVELAPDDVLARRALLHFYESMGMGLNAARERQALAKLRNG